MTAQKPTPAEFYQTLRYHDWFSYMSDDHGVFMRGEQASKLLRETAESDPVLKSLYDRYRAHVLSGPAFDKPLIPEPTDPFNDEYLDWLVKLTDPELRRAMEWQADYAEKRHRDIGGCSVDEAMNLARRRLYFQHRGEYEVSDD